MRSLRSDSSALSELAILLILILAIIVVIALIAGGIILSVGLFFGGRLGIGLFLFITGGLTLVAMRWIHHNALFWLGITQFVLAIVFLVLGALGR